MVAVRWYGGQVQAEFNRHFERMLDIAALVVERRAKALIRQPKSGKAPPSGRSVKAQARRLGIQRQSQRAGITPTGRVLGWRTPRSAPGEAPANQTGRLLASITHEKPRALARRIGTNLRYARYLEMGVRGGKVIGPRKKKALAWMTEDVLIVRRRVIQGSIAPRPFLRPALYGAGREITEAWARYSQGVR